jgi:tetratricopeptide (TPR) repeat protein
VYFWKDAKIYSISTEEGSEPQEIVWCSSCYPAVLWDGKDIRYMAFTGWYSPLVHILDVASKSPHRIWGGFKRTLFADFSPDGRMLAVAGGYHCAEGLWIYDMESGKARRLLNGMIIRGRWSPDGSKMAFALAPPWQEIWIADTESLSPGKTLKQHYQERIDFFTRRIKTNPQDQWGYYNRALFNMYLGRRDETLDDLKRYVGPADGTDALAQAYSDLAWRSVRRCQEVVNTEIAVELANEAARMQPENGEYLCALGAALYRAHQYQEAATKLEQASHQPSAEDVRCYFLLAMANWQLEDKTASENWYKKAMEWKNDHTNDWFSVNGEIVADLYSEAAHLMGKQIEEF